MGKWAICVHGGAGLDPNLPLHRQENLKSFSEFINKVNRLV